MKEMQCPFCKKRIAVKKEYEESGICPQCGKTFYIHWIEWEDDDGGSAYQYLSRDEEGEETDD